MVRKSLCTAVWSYELQATTAFFPWSGYRWNLEPPYDIRFLWLLFGGKACFRLRTHLPVRGVPVPVAHEVDAPLLLPPVWPRDAHLVAEQYHVLFVACENALWEITQFENTFEFSPSPLARTWAPPPGGWTGCWAATRACPPVSHTVQNII